MADKASNGNQQRDKSVCCENVMDKHLLSEVCGGNCVVYWSSLGSLGFTGVYWCYWRLLDITEGYWSFLEIGWLLCTCIAFSETHSQSLPTSLQMDPAVLTKKTWNITFISCNIKGDNTSQKDSHRELREAQIRAWCRSQHPL